MIHSTWREYQKSWTTYRDQQVYGNLMNLLQQIQEDRKTKQIIEGKKWVE